MNDKIKTLIVNFNRLTLTKNMVEFLADHGHDIIIIDNASTYHPLLEWYKKSCVRVVYMNDNHGSHVVWNADLLNRLEISGRYVITDPDLDLSNVPPDFMTILHRGLDEYPEYSKCGLSLEINDLPDTEMAHLMRTKYEKKYWEHPLDAQYFHADTDTTFALYRETNRTHDHNAIRTNRPYTARHVPWYYINIASLPDDEQYYYQHAGPSASGKKFLPWT